MSFKNLHAWFWIAGLLLFTCATTDAQDRRRNLPDISAPGPVERTSSGNTAEAITYIQDVKTSINRATFTITFYSSPGLVPKIEIGTVPPRQQHGRWVFPEGESAGEGNAFASQRTGPLSRRIGTSANTFYTFESAMFQLSALKPGTTYHYIISIPGNDSTSQHQTTGSFTTPALLLKVVFESVKIINDGDPDAPRPIPPDCGEIDLWFWANYGQPSPEFFMIRNLSRGAPIKACTDHLYDINRQFTIENPPNALTLSISGRDRDGDNEIGSELFESSRPAPFVDPRDTGDEEQNVAIGAFDLTKLNYGATQRFTIVSKQAHGGSAGDLMFEVYGYITIKSPQP